MNQYNEIASSTVGNFDKGRSCYFKFYHMKTLPIFSTNKKRSALSFTFFKKASQKNPVIFKNFNGRYFLLAYHRNVNFGLFWEAKVQFLKNVVWLILSK